MIRFGYSASPLRSLARLMVLSTIKRAHREAVRRILALIAACPYRDAQGHSLLGIGTAWRSAEQQSRGGSSHAGVWRSWHQGRSPSDDTDALAFDLVDWTSGQAQGDGPAMRWANNNCGRFGLKHFRDVNREPWHHQPTEVSTARSYMQPIPHSLPHISLPGGAAEPSPVDPGASREGVPAPTLRDGSTGPQADMLRDVLAFWGWRNITAMQQVLGVTADGIYGPVTAQVYSNFLDAMELVADRDRPAGAGVSYTVVEGDTVSAVAKRFGSSVSKVAAASGLDDPSRIAVGQKLTIPDAAFIAREVRAGDTASALAKQYGTTVADVARVNALSDPGRIRSGQVLYLPVKG